MIINLWNPTVFSFFSALAISFLLGIVHGITPDEHTWPITFSYAIGSYSTKGGMKAGMLFSSGFTIQRALLSEVGYLALAGVFLTVAAAGISYMVVGIAMTGAGVYIAYKKNYLHFHTIEALFGRLVGLHKKGEHQEKAELSHETNPVIRDSKPIPLRLAFLHGIIAGFGFGAFALIIVTVIAPSMPSIYLGWVPGLLFGLGTMTMQILFGAGFGTWLSRTKKLTKQGIAFVAKGVSGYVLTYGGLVFIAGGVLVLAFPQILSYGINTGLKVHNLDSLNLGFFLVVGTVIVLGYLGYLKSIKNAVNLGFINSEKEIESHMKSE